MGGKVWSEEEERVFWTEIVPTSSKRLLHDRPHAQDAKGWEDLCQVMQQTMGDQARRQYTALMLYEHFFQNSVLKRLSPNAARYVRAYLSRNRGTDGVNPSRRSRLAEVHRQPRNGSARRRGNHDENHGEIPDNLANNGNSDRRDPLEFTLDAIQAPFPSPGTIAPGMHNGISTGIYENRNDYGFDGFHAILRAAHADAAYGASSYGAYVYSDSYDDNAYGCPVGPGTAPAYQATRPADTDAAATAAAAAQGLLPLPPPFMPPLRPLLGPQWMPPAMSSPAAPLAELLVPPPPATITMPEGKQHEQAAASLDEPGDRQCPQDG